MLKNWFIYITVVIALCIFSIMYIKFSGFIILIVVVIVPLVDSLLSYLFSSKSIGVFLCKDFPVFNINKSVKCRIELVSKSKIVEGSQVDVQVVVRGLGRNAITKMKKKTTLQGKKQTIEFEYTPMYSGLHELSVEKISVHSSFSLFCPNLRVKKRCSFLVMPEYKEFVLVDDTMTEENEGDSDRYSSRQAGNDPSEVYKIREYQLGDKLNRVNWKLTAKNGEIMVQDYGFSLACDTAVFFDISGDMNRNQIEKANQILYYLSIQFALLGKMIYVVWKDFNEKNISKKLIVKDDDIYELFDELFRSDLRKQDTSLEDLYHAESEGEFLTESIFISSRKDKPVTEIMQEKLMTQIFTYIRV